MTRPVTPATDEEVEGLRGAAQGGHEIHEASVLALCARIDAEKARAERLLNDLSEAAVRAGEDFMRRLEMKKDAKALHTHALGVAADNAALRGELADAREWMRGGEKWDEVQAAVRAHITKTEAERDAERAARDRGDDAEAQRLSDEIDRHSLSRTLRGRVGSWLIKLGARLGGLHAHDRRAARPRWTPTPPEPGEYDGGGRWPRGDG